MSLRSVLSKNLISELRGGLYSGPRRIELRLLLVDRLAQRSQQLRGSGGFAITTPTNTTDWFTSNAPSWRAAPTYSIDEALTWQAGAHTYHFGGNVLVSNATSSGPADRPTASRSA